MRRGVPTGLAYFGVATALSVLALLGIPEGDTGRSPPDPGAPRPVVDAPPSTTPASPRPVLANHH
ncbi:MAG: hypothetical protein WEC34_15515 [Acidimicrobiia bacterium]|jgi:hypothetical protein